MFRFYSHPGLSLSLLLRFEWADHERDVVSPHSHTRTQAYEAYKAAISVNGVLNGNETQVFHGCAEAAMDVDNPASIVRTGFLKKYTCVTVKIYPVKSQLNINAGVNLLFKKH